MKSTAIWALALLNVGLLGLLVSRNMKPNAAIAQQNGGRVGDYVIIPVDFPGANVGSVIVLDNVSGQLSAIQTEESTGRMYALPRVNVTELFDAAAGRNRNTPKPNR
jgi:hypothetical protein